MLYIATLHENGSSSCNFGYVDDIVTVKVGSTPSKAIEAVQEEVDKIVQLALTHMIRFDPSKCELLVMGGGSKKKLDL